MGIVCRLGLMASVCTKSSTSSTIHQTRVRILIYINQDVLFRKMNVASRPRTDSAPRSYNFIPESLYERVLSCNQYTFSAISRGGPRAKSGQDMA